MDATSFFLALLSTQSPLLPAPLAFRLYLDVAWGLVLAALTLPWLAQRKPQWHPHLWWPWLLVFVCLLPDGLSPAHWLGLAMRAPSALLTLLCVWTLWNHYRPSGAGSGPLQALRAWSWPLVALGWVLLLDTFALLPFSLYAWGSAPALLGALALTGLLPALMTGRMAMPALWTAALLLYVLLRLPTGNAWDAVLDPALWIWLQVDALRRLRRRD